MIFANPKANSINLAPSPYAHVLTRVTPNNPMRLASTVNPPNEGYVNGTVPQPPARALPSPTNIKNLIDSLPSLFDIYHG